MSRKNTLKCKEPNISTKTFSIVDRKSNLISDFAESGPQYFLQDTEKINYFYHQLDSSLVHVTVKPVSVASCLNLEVPYDSIVKDKG